MEDGNARQPFSMFFRYAAEAGKGYSKTGGFVRTQQYQYDKNLYNLFGR